MRSRLLRIAVGAVGVALAVYGVSRLERWRRGSAPQRWRPATDDEIRWKWIEPAGSTQSVEEVRRFHNPTMPDWDWNESWKRNSAGITVLGLVLAFGAWARRSKPRPPTVA